MAASSAQYPHKHPDGKSPEPSFETLTSPQWRCSRETGKGEVQGGSLHIFYKACSKGFPSAKSIGDCGDSHADADDTAPLEDLHATLLDWDTVGNLAITAATEPAQASDLDEPEPTPRDILLTVTSCKFAITELTSEIKGVKTEIAFIRHDMQKLRDHTTALEGHLSTLEDEWAPL